MKESVAGGSEMISNAILIGYFECFKRTARDVTVETIIG